MADGDEPQAPAHATRIEIAPRTIAWLGLAIGAVWLARQLWSVVVVVIVALVLAGTFDPFVAWLEKRGLGRGRALALIFVVGALAVAGIVLVTVPPLVSQLRHIVEDAPSERRRLLDWLAQYHWGAQVAKAIRAVPLDELFARAGNALLGYSSEILAALGYAITTLVLALYLLADPTHAKALLYALVPRHRHVKLARILIELKTIVGGYMRGQVIMSVAVTVFVLGLLTAFRVDNALAIAVFAGLTDVVPFIGGYLASIPAVLAAIPNGTVAAVVVACAMFAYQELETRIIRPRVYGRALRMSSAAVLLALLVGGTLMGILGALLALPIAAGMQMVVRELRVELPGESGLDERVRARDEKAEQVYERLSAGAPIEEAAAIAGKVAATLKHTEENGSSVTAEMETLKDEKKK